jgi:hypothetical protein
MTIIIVTPKRETCLTFQDAVDDIYVKFSRLLAFDYY